MAVIEAREDGTIIGVFGRPLKPIDNGHGYMYVNVRVDGRQQHRYVHHLVCEAFHGPRPEGMEVAHNDGNTKNNAASNLRWDTPTNNHADKKAHGTHLSGESSPRAKLTQRDAEDIRDLYDLGHSQREIAEQYGVSQITISRVVRRERYATS